MTVSSLITAGLLATALSPAAPPPVAPPPRAVPPRPVVPRLDLYRGFVVAVDAQSITVRGSETGRPNEVVVTRRFMAGAALLNGEQDRDYNSAADHRLKDVRIGDRVYLTLRQSDVPDVCATVRIERRPGGVVPPAPWDAPDNPNPVHEYLNAWQAFEEKGTPLPEKYDPVAQERKAAEKDRLETEFRARWEWARDHTAPPPRAARPRK